MTHNRPGGGRPIRELVFVGVIVAMLLAAPLVLYALTDPAARPDLLTRISSAIGTGGTALLAGLAWLDSRRNRSVAERTQEAVETVAQQTNGNMTALIARNDQEDRARDEHDWSPPR